MEKFSYLAERGQEGHNQLGEKDLSRMPGLTSENVVEESISIRRR